MSGAVDAPAGARLASSRPEAIRAFARYQLPVYALALAAAEGIALALGRLAGALAEAGILAVMLNQCLLLGDAAERDGERKPIAQALAVLALVPLLRLLALTLPVRTLHPIYGYALVAGPLLIAAIVARRRIGRLDALRRRGGAIAQILVAAAGLPLGAAACVILWPQPLAVGGQWSQVALVSIAILVLAAVTEELVFRGLVQRALVAAIGPWGMVWASGLFGITYVGTGSAPFVVFMCIVGLLFGAAYRTTGSLVGISISHGLLNVGLLVVFPLLLGRW